jgi:hypothetical protein
MRTYRPRKSTFKPVKPVAAPRVKLFTHQRQVVLSLGQLGECVRALTLLNQARVACHDSLQCNTNSTTSLINLLAAAAAPAVPPVVEPATGPVQA